MCKAYRLLNADVSKAITLDHANFSSGSRFFFWVTLKFVTQKKKMRDPEEWFLQFSECGKFVIEYLSPNTSYLEYLSTQQHDTVVLFDTYQPQATRACDPE